jgi:hypothetical protein
MLCRSIPSGSTNDSAGSPLAISLREYLVLLVNEAVGSLERLSKVQRHGSKEIPLEAGQCLEFASCELLVGHSTPMKFLHVVLNFCYHHQIRVWLIKLGS